MADFPLHTNTGPWLGSWLAAIFENIKIKMKAHVWAKILRQENFQAGPERQDYSHSVFEKLFVQWHPKSHHCIISLFWKSSSLYVQKSPVCTQAPNWLHLGTPSASEDHFRIYYSRPWGQAPHKRQKQSEYLLKRYSPVIPGVTTIHVVWEADPYIIKFKSMHGSPTQNQNDRIQLI